MILYKKRSSKTLLRETGAKFFLIVLVSISMLSLSSCDKESSVGLGVQPVNDLLKVGFQDSTTVFSKTQREDSLRSDQNLVTSGQVIIGKYIDPIFGMSEASLYTQLRLTTDIAAGSNPFGNNPVCDSLVLQMVYADVYYGESIGKGPLKRQRVSVYEVTGNFPNPSYYYSDSVTAFNKTNDLANGFTFYPDISKPVHIIEYTSGKAKLDTLVPQLRVPLQPLFGQTILNNVNNGNLSSNDIFQNFCKGLYITDSNTTGLSAGEGRILSYDMPSSNVILYYHNDTCVSAHQPVLQEVFVLSAVGRYAKFKRDYYTDVNVLPDIHTQITDTNRTHSYGKNYIQSMAGAKAKIRFPYIMNWIKGGAIAINQAELIVKVDPTTITYRQDYFDPPSALLLFGINDDGSSYLLPDLTQAPYYYNGTYDAVNQQYVLNISRYIQELLDKKINNNGLYLTVPHISGDTKANRVVIGGAAPKNSDGSANNYQMKLNITYTKLH